MIYDIVITELGGTVGDIESLALPGSDSTNALGTGHIDNCLVIHLTFIPYLSAAKEFKTKPTQHSVKELLNRPVFNLTFWFAGQSTPYPIWRLKQ